MFFFVVVQVVFWHRIDDVNSFCAVICRDSSNAYYNVDFNVLTIAIVTLIGRRDSVGSTVYPELRRYKWLLRA